MICADWTALSAFQGPSGGFLSDRPRDQIACDGFPTCAEFDRQKVWRLGELGGAPVGAVVRKCRGQR